MIIKNEEMFKEVKNKMRDGEGDIELTHIVPNKNLIHSRLMAFIKIPVGASIGEHEHLNETEYYIITKGNAVIVDNGQERQAKQGDVVITGDKQKHSIKNTGNTDLEFIAIIILH